MRDPVLYIIHTYICVHIHICTGIRMYVIYKLVFHLLVSVLRLWVKCITPPLPPVLCALCAASAFNIYISRGEGRRGEIGTRKRFFYFEHEMKVERMACAFCNSAPHTSGQDCRSNDPKEFPLLRMGGTMYSTSKRNSRAYHVVFYVVSTSRGGRGFARRLLFTNVKE